MKRALLLSFLAVGVAGCRDERHPSRMVMMLIRGEGEPARCETAEKDGKVIELHCWWKP
jgi:hypothetical protein